MTPFSATTISTTGLVKSGQGVISFAQAVGGDLILYEGSTSGQRLATIVSSDHITLNTPVQFSSTGLYATISAGYGIVHLG